jgi:hypothetical protein
MAGRDDVLEGAEGVEAGEQWHGQAAAGGIQPE